MSPPALTLTPPCLVQAPPANTRTTLQRRWGSASPGSARSAAGQVQLAGRTGIVQIVLSDYEIGKVRLNADMIVRFDQALDVTTDQMLQPQAEPNALRRKPSLRVPPSP